MNRRVRFVFVVMLVAVSVLATPQTVFAAMDATLSSSHARPGDFVLLLTDDHQGTWNYELLSTKGHQPIYLAPATGNRAEACGGPGSQLVGMLQWRGNSGGVHFVVPDLPTGEYWLFMQPDGQCWRVAAGAGASHRPLVLSIGTVPADNQDVAASWTVDSLAPSAPTLEQRRTSPPHSPSRILWVGIGGGCALVLLTIVIAWVKLGRPSQRNRDLTI